MSNDPGRGTSRSSAMTRALSPLSPPRPGVLLTSPTVPPATRSIAVRDHRSWRVPCFEHRARTLLRAQPAVQDETRTGSCTSRTGGAHRGPLTPRPGRASRAPSALQGVSSTMHAGDLTLAVMLTAVGAIGTKTARRPLDDPARRSPARTVPREPAPAARVSSRVPGGPHRAAGRSGPGGSAAGAAGDPSRSTPGARQCWRVIQDRTSNLGPARSLLPLGIRGAVGQWATPDGRHRVR